MHIDCLADTNLTESARMELAAYRYDIFVGQLGWDLPCEPGCDQDQFDIAEALHVTARAPHGHLIGYARLLPTTGCYLLAELFPQLLGTQIAPKDASVWELSRYTARDPHDAGDTAAELVVGKSLLLQSLRAAAGQGAERLIFCTTVAIERLAKRWGVDIRRVATPQRIGDQLLVAALIEFNAQTVAALDVIDDECGAEIQSRAAHTPAHTGRPFN
jgi:acyl homoserine lactone synthase